MKYFLRILPTESKTWGNGYVAIPQGHRLNGHTHESINLALRRTRYQGPLLSFSGFASYNAAQGIVEGERLNEADWVVGFTTAFLGWSKEEVREATWSLRHALMDLDPSD